MYRNLNKKIFHVIMVVIIVFVILCIAGILVLRYQVEGESNMPFEITRIGISESTEGISVEGATERWNYNVSFNNDIYVWIEPNSGYGKTEIIDEVEICNINIDKQNEKGEIKLYKPIMDGMKKFINATENEISEITYKGELESNMKEQKISNQGGIIAFRYAINNLSQYISDSGEEIQHNQLLKLTNITEEDLKTNISFDIIIKLTSGKKYQTTINFDIPTEEIIEKGVVGKEITDLEDIIFKRIEN